MEDRKVCEVSRFCGACSSTLGVVPSTYGAHAEPQALRNLEINKDCKVCVCVSVVPCPSCARIIAQDGRVKEVRFGNSSGLNMSGVKSLLEKHIGVKHVVKTPVVWNKELYAKQLVRRNITSPVLKWNLTNMCLLSKMRLRGKRLLRYFPQKNTVLVNDEVSSKLSIVCKDAQFCTHRKGDPRTVQAQKLVYVLHIKTKTARPIPIVSDKGNFRRTFQGKPEGAGSGGQALSKVSKVHAQKSVDQKMLDVTNMEKKDLEEIGNRIVNVKDAKELQHQYCRSMKRFWNLTVEEKRSGAPSRKTDSTEVAGIFALKTKVCGLRSKKWKEQINSGGIKEQIMEQSAMKMKAMVKEEIVTVSNQRYNAIRGIRQLLFGMPNFRIIHGLLNESADMTGRDDFGNDLRKMILSLMSHSGSHVDKQVKELLEKFRDELTKLDEKDKKAVLSMMFARFRTSQDGTVTFKMSTSTMHTHLMRMNCMVEHARSAALAEKRRKAKSGDDEDYGLEDEHLDDVDSASEDEDEDSDKNKAADAAAGPSKKKAAVKSNQDKAGTLNFKNKEDRLNHMVDLAQSFMSSIKCEDMTTTMKRKLRTHFDDGAEDAECPFKVPKKGSREASERVALLGVRAFAPTRLDVTYS